MAKRQRDGLVMVALREATSDLNQWERRRFREELVRRLPAFFAGIRAVAIEKREPTKCNESSNQPYSSIGAPNERAK